MPEDSEELALTLGAKKRKLTRKSFELFGKNLGFNDKQIDGVFKHFLKNKSKSINLIKRSFLSDNMQYKYIALMESRYDALY